MHTAAGANTVKSLQTNLAQAVNGFPAMVAADNAAYANNPTAFINAESKQYRRRDGRSDRDRGDNSPRSGIAKGVGTTVKAGIKLATSSAAVDDAVAVVVDSTAPAAPGSTAELIQNANAATSQFQTLPEGTALSSADASQVGGLLPGDQVGFQKALNYVFNKFGVQLEVGARTSEPLSLGITGSPKLTFMKPKAVSAMDMMLGAPSEIAAYTPAGQTASGQVFKGGVTTVFDPVPIPPPSSLRSPRSIPPSRPPTTPAWLRSRNCGRNTKDPTSTLRVLVQGSSETKGGVTAIASLPGYPVPLPPAGAQPLVYLEQLDQPAFQAQFGLSSSQAQTLKTSLANSPGAVKVDYIARSNPGGSISFFDGLANNQPIVSDLDLQYIQPANGAPGRRAWTRNKSLPSSMSSSSRT